MSRSILALLLITSVLTIDRHNSRAESAKPIRVKQDWPQWGGSPTRNNTPAGQNIATAWDIKTGENIKWSVRLGGVTYGSPVVANGRVFVGTNNGCGYVKRYPRDVDLGCLLCFDELSGNFLWQHSNEKLASGRDQDYSLNGICCSPLVEGERLWYVTNRCEVVCLDTAGFHDGKNDGPYLDEPNQNRDEADVVWKLDMIGKLGVFPHQACACSVTAAGNLLFVVTSNGVDGGNVRIPSPHAPSFLCLDKHTGEVLWSDNSPGLNILQAQWCSPAYGILGGVEQVLFGGGDGWLYSFDPYGEQGRSKLLWKFDCNPKTSRYRLGSRGERCHLLGMPVIWEGRVHIAVGDNPEHGSGKGHLWCIDPGKRGDVSPTLVYNKADRSRPIAQKRLQACEPNLGDYEIPNPNSALVWHYAGKPAATETTNGKQEIPVRSEKPDETTQGMNHILSRALGTVAISRGLLCVADFEGILHCVDAKTGHGLWTHDLQAACWTSPLIVEGRVYIGDEDGDVSIFALSPRRQLVANMQMQNPICTTPIVANNVLYIARQDRLFAIVPGARSKPRLETKPGE